MPQNLPSSDTTIIDLTPDNIADWGVCGYKDVAKHLELQRKIAWFKQYYPLGLRIKALVSKSGGYQGMLEYIPGKYAHRPVQADGYMFIHCIFVGFKGEFKGKGHASRMLDLVIAEAKDAGMKGVAVVTRKGSFMAKKDIFIKKGFHVVDLAKPDFELLALKFRADAEDPKFKVASTADYAEGLTVIRSPQCPYSVKNVDAILETAKEMGLKTKLLDFDTAESAQQSPCAFGTFCIIKDGKILSHHPISNTRFENIIKKA
ncbi:MAG: YoaP domain-containing protein [Candidatus Bathyarchaeota archaeon]|nr:YoaP domain-containing protein [Candidatus Bathyarchaeota archaeon]